LVFLQGATTAPNQTIHSSSASASVDIGIDFLCRKTNKNVNQMPYKEIAQAPCSTFLVNLTVAQLVKNFTAYYRTQRFITSLTSSHHLPIP
jgi:hypothetical protein